MSRTKASRENVANTPRILYLDTKRTESISLCVRRTSTEGSQTGKEADGLQQWSEGWEGNNQLHFGLTSNHSISE